MMRVNRSENGIASFVFAALARDHTDRPAVLGGYARDIDIGDDIAAEILDARDERLRQPAAAPDRHSDAVSCHESDENEDAEAGGFFVRRNEILPGNACEVHAHLVVLEVLAEHIVSAHLHHAPELAALTALVKHGVGSADRYRRGVETGGDHRQPSRPLRREPAKAVPGRRERTRT